MWSNNYYFLCFLQLSFYQLPSNPDTEDSATSHKDFENSETKNTDAQDNTEQNGTTEYQSSSDEEDIWASSENVFRDMASPYYMSAAEDEEDLNGIKRRLLWLLKML